MDVQALLSWRLVSGVADVLLVSFLIYRFFLLVRGTRAEQMLLGLGVVVLVYVISRFLNFTTLNWILGNFLGSVILVIVVLFQENLRRALTKVGIVPGFGSNIPKAIERSIREVSKAAAELSTRRVGALMVIRREVGLEEYTEHAVEIDASVSYQLLVSIFLPMSPIHDGAVIIEGERILVAGSVLPLSFDMDIAKDYGTRHRAALGLSEKTDAIIVVVSEETGTISLVRDGRITKDLNEAALYNALRRLTAARHNKKKTEILASSVAPVPEEKGGSL